MSSFTIFLPPYFHIQEIQYVVDIPYFAALKHACVHDVGAHKSSLHSFNLISQQLMGQRLMEAHSSKLTGTVILSQTKIVTCSECLIENIQNYLQLARPTQTAVFCDLRLNLLLHLLQRTV